MKYFAAIVVSGLLAIQSSRALADDVPATQPIADVIKPTLVTLDLDKATAAEAFKALQKQSNINPNFAPPDLLDRSDSSISIKVQDRPWLEVLLAICEQAGVAPANYGNNWNITQQGDRRLNARRFVSGPTLIACYNISTDSEIRYGDNAKVNRTITLQGILCAEPTASISGIASVSDIVAIDNLGRRIPSVASGRIMYSSGYDRRDFSISLQPSDDDATSIKSVSGTLLASMLAESDDLKIPDLLRQEGQHFKVRGATFTVNDVRFVGNWYQVEIEVDRGTLPAETVLRLRTNQAPFDPRVEDQQQAGLIRVNQVRTRDDVQTMTLTVRPQNVGNNQPGNDDERPTVNLLWTIPIAYRHVEIPFEFADFPIPR